MWPCNTPVICSGCRPATAAIWCSRKPTAQSVRRTGRENTMDKSFQGWPSINMQLSENCQSNKLNKIRSSLIIVEQHTGRPQRAELIKKKNDSFSPKLIYRQFPPLQSPCCELLYRWRYCTRNRSCLVEIATFVFPFPFLNIFFVLLSFFSGVRTKLPIHCNYFC